MAEAVAKLTCGACGKAYAWKPQYAGKTLKCSCGESIKAGAAPSLAPAPARAVAAGAPRKPAVAAPQPASVSAEDEFERMMSASYDVADDAPPVEAPAPKKVAPAGAALVAAVPGGVKRSGPPQLGYASKGQYNKAAADAKQAAIHEIYIPVGLILAAIIVYYLNAYLLGLNPLVGLAYILVSAGVRLVLVFLGLMIGVQMIDLGLGAAGPAMLKIAAVALLPGALSDLMSIYTYWVLPWVLSIGMYVGLLYYLFDMDGQEIGIVTGIISVIGRVAFYIVIAVFIKTNTAPSQAVTIGLVGAPPQPQGPVDPETIPDTATPAPRNAPPPPPGHQETPKEKAQRIARERVEKADHDLETEIKSDKAFDAREWLKPEFDMHSGTKDGSNALLEWVEKLYAAGAKHVWVSDIQHAGRYEMAQDFIVEMPDEPDAREAVLGVMGDLNFHFPRDRTNRYFKVLIERER